MFYKFWYQLISYSLLTGSSGSAGFLEQALLEQECDRWHWMYQRGYFRKTA